MSYILKPSLEYITLVTIATKLWNLHDIRNLMKKFCISLNDRELRDKWGNIEDIMLRKVPQLPLPELLKEKTSVFVKAIGYQILNYIEYHRDMLCFNIGLPNKFYWTPRGTVDKKKMAKMLIVDEAIDITVRYQLACIYCLESDIQELWNEIPKDHKENFYTEENLQHTLVSFWTYNILGEVAKMESMIEKRSNHRCSAYLYAFLHAAVSGKGVAAEYLLQKLTSAEKKKCLINIVRSVVHLYSYQIDLFLKEEYSDILCILLSEMDNAQQMELFQSDHRCILECFLDWPRQIFFMETISWMWDFLPTADYYALLKKIIDKLRNGCKDFNYQKLLREMWQQSPRAHKIYIFQETLFSYMPSTLFKIKDENNLQLILQDTTDTEKIPIFLSL